jgi:hypothetical protein
LAEAAAPCARTSPLAHAFGHFWHSSHRETAVDFADTSGTWFAESGKGSRKNKFPEFALRFAPDSVATIERIRRHSRGHVEEFTIEERPKMA